MSNKNCNTCLFGDVCVSKKGCEYYSPTDDDMDDAELERYIETGRQKYLSSWWRYIKDDYEKSLYFSPINLIK